LGNLTLRYSDVYCRLDYLLLLVMYMYRLLMSYTTNEHLQLHYSATSKVARSTGKRQSTATWHPQTQASAIELIDDDMTVPTLPLRSIDSLSAASGIIWL
jgi:hypothetical protein